jgi:hypothetical protein
MIDDRGDAGKQRAAVPLACRSPETVLLWPNCDPAAVCGPLALFVGDSQAKV